MSAGKVYDIRGDLRTGDRRENTRHGQYPPCPFRQNQQHYQGDKGESGAHVLETGRVRGSRQAQVPSELECSPRS